MTTTYKRDEDTRDDEEKFHSIVHADNPAMENKSETSFTEIQRDEKTIENAEIEKDKPKEIPICLSLTENLVENLEVLKTIDTATRFTRLLIESKKIVEKEDLKSSSSENEDIKIFNELNTIVLEHEFCHTLVTSLTKVFHVSEDSDLIKNIVLNLAAITKSQFDSYETSKECITELLQNIENFVNTHQTYYLKFKKEALLLKLLRALTRFGIFICEDALCLIFKIFKGPVNLSIEDEEKIGILMVGALKHIRNRVEYTPNHCSYRPLFTHLQVRSALQFIQDNFAAFPTGEGKLFKDYMAEINTDIHILDTMLDTLFLPDSSDDEDDEYDEGDTIFVAREAFESIKLQMIEEMPKSHAPWWRKYCEWHY